MYLILFMKLFPTQKRLRLVRTNFNMLFQKHRQALRKVSLDHSSFRIQKAAAAFTKNHQRTFAKRAHIQKKRLLFKLFQIRAGGMFTQRFTFRISSRNLRKSIFFVFVMIFIAMRAVRRLCYPNCSILNKNVINSVFNQFSKSANSFRLFNVDKKFYSQESLTEAYIKAKQKCECKTHLSLFNPSLLLFYIQFLSCFMG